MKNIMEKAFRPHKVSKYVPKHTLTTSEREDYEAIKIELAVKKGMSKTFNTTRQFNNRY
jgi:hypothetical protein